MTLGTILVLLGQGLNFGAFYRLGTLGVFYGAQLGHEIQRSREFPFTLFDHPQYVGALLSIWGFFIATCFPHSDWFLLPILETVYYSIGAWLEA